MGNLEKAGVGVVVLLLAVILGTAFVGDDENPKLNAQREEKAGLMAGGGTTDTPAPAPARGGSSAFRERGDDGAREQIGPEDVIRPQAPGRDVTVPPRDERREDAVVDRDAASPPPAAPESSPTAPPEWPKTVKVTKADVSLTAMARRVYGAKDGPAMIPAILKSNPGLKPTAMRIGQDVTMPEKPAPKAVAVERDVAKDARNSADPKAADPKSAAPKSKSPATTRAAKATKSRGTFLPVR